MREPRRSEIRIGREAATRPSSLGSPRECGFAAYIDDTMRDGEGGFRLIPAAATDRGAR